MPQAGQKLICVIIATYQRPQSLSAVLQSVLKCRKDESFEFEVIVADNNSKDNTKEVVEDLMPKFGGRLKYIFEAKQGKNNALNSAIKIARGDYLALTDDDCLVAEDWLMNIVPVMNQSKADILCGKIIPIFSGQVPEWVDLKKNVFQGPLVYVDLGDQYVDCTKTDFLPTGANMIVTRRAFDKFSITEQRTRAQDSEIGYSWKKRGAVIGYSPDILVYHQTPVERLNKKYFRDWQYLCGKNSAMIFSDTYQDSQRRIFDVPLWVYRKLFQNIWRYIKGIVGSENNFANELWIWHRLGEISALREAKGKI